MDFAAFLNLFPAFSAGEKIVHFKRWIWAGSSKSGISYRIFMSLPLLQESAFYVTDRRVLIVSYVLRILKQEFSLFYRPAATGRGGDVIQEVRCGQHWLTGPYLEIVSQNDVKCWCRAKELRVRLSMKNPQLVQELIAAAANGTSRGNQ